MNLKRQKVVLGVDFNWSSTSWIHNVFRLYELIFWRREGIRPAISAYQNSDGTTTYAFHSFEAALNLLESKIRGLLQKFELQKVYLPVFVAPGAPVFSSPYLFAIAVQNTANGSPVAGTTRNLSMIVGSGSNLFLATAFETQAGTDPVTGVVFNTSETMTQGKKLQESFLSTFWLYIYYEVNPTVTTANITISQGTSSGGPVAAVSYTGASQGALDSATSGSTPSGTTFAQAFTTVANNAWTLNLIRCDAGGATPTASTGSTLRSTTPDGGTRLFDSNAAVTPAGSYTMNYTDGGVTSSFNSVGISIAPAGGTVASSKLPILGAS